MKITRPNQVWAADITYIPMARGFLYLVAVIDWYSRYVLSWRLSNALDAGFCIEALEEALTKGRPEIFNTDQGSQFTGEVFTGLLEKHGIRVSMDGKGSYSDNLFIEGLWRANPERPDERHSCWLRRSPARGTGQRSPAPPASRHASTSARPPAPARHPSVLPR